MTANKYCHFCYLGATIFQLLTMNATLWSILRILPGWPEDNIGLLLGCPPEDQVALSCFCKWKIRVFQIHVMYTKKKDILVKKIIQWLFI